jgi:amino acid transporter
MGVNMALAMILPFVTYSASDLYGYLGTIATLTVLVAYGMMNVATLVHFARRDLRAGKAYRLVPPIVGLLISGYVLFANLYPVPAAPFNLFPFVAGAYMLVGGAILVFSPRDEDERAIDGYLLHGITVEDATPAIEEGSQA